jgi:hypothetical protein
MPGTLPLPDEGPLDGRQRSDETPRAICSHTHLLPGAAVATDDDHGFGAQAAMYGRERTRLTIMPTNITALVRERPYPAANAPVR